MMITRHNYEEYFLMYVDNELTTEERAAVELFARQNPDVAPELDMLLRTRLSTDDTLHFTDKNTLLQNADSIGLDNYEEQFLLYIDDELDKEKKEGVEKFVLQHPQFQDEFTLLKQTVLEPELIVFKDKDSLLKREERRIIPLFIRLAAAAAIISIAVLVWWMQDTNTTSTTGIAAVKTDSLKENAASVNTNDKKTTLPEIVITPQLQNKHNETVALQSQTVKQEKETAIGNNEQKNRIPKSENSVSVLNPNDNTVAVNNTNTTHDNEGSNGFSETVSANRTATASVDNEQHANDNGVRNAGNPDAANSNIYAKNALYKELNTDVEDERSLLYVGSIEFNKNKVRGLMKKVGGLFAGRSKDGLTNEDGKLQIANLELNTN
ncbi:MAG: hypothetical protein ABI861_11295 [Panacibacter sp.]